MILTVITPTTGKNSLDTLIQSVESQKHSEDIFHFLLWDDFRSDGARVPESYNSVNRLSLVLPKGSGRNGSAPGSALRSVGLMAVQTPWVTFADDDVWWEPNHVEELLKSVSNGEHWGRTYRTIWSPTHERLGIDKFESVGDDESRKVPYEMCDNNCMMFKREYGVYAAHLYRETKDYNDDRLMYQFLRNNAGNCGKTNKATINHICPEKLITFFSENCDQK